MDENKTRKPARMFRATAVKKPDSTGLGLEQYSGKGDHAEVTAIHSVYFPDKLSNRDIAVNLLQYVESLLKDEEYAIIRGLNIRNKPSWNRPYSPQVELRQTGYNPAFDDVVMLANDSLKRKNTITEVL